MYVKISTPNPQREMQTWYKSVLLKELNATYIKIIVPLFFALAVLLWRY